MQSLASRLGMKVVSFVLKPIAVGYAAVCVSAFLAQRQLQYFPSEQNPPHPRSVSHAFATIREIELQSADQTKCLLWHWEEPKTMQPPNFWWIANSERRKELTDTCTQLRRANPDFAKLDVLLLHGNAGDRSHRLGWMHLLRDGLGVSVTVLDYRGYGGSEGSPTEKGLIADGAAAARWLRVQQLKRGKRGRQRKLVLWGESIGGGVAVAIAAEEKMGDLMVIEAGFSSCVDIAASFYPWFPFLNWFMHDKFESVKRAKHIPTTLPVLHLHGTLDDIADISLGRRLFESLPCTSKRFVEFRDTGHNNIPYRDPVRYVKELATFLAQNK